MEAIRMSTSDDKMSPPVISGGVFSALDDFHQTAAMVLERKGKLIIEPETTGKCHNITVANQAQNLKMHIPEEENYDRKY
jgi:hypothetical protein